MTAFGVGDKVRWVVAPFHGPHGINRGDTGVVVVADGRAGWGLLVKWDTQVQGHDGDEPEGTYDGRAWWTSPSWIEDVAQGDATSGEVVFKYTDLLHTGHPRFREILAEIQALHDKKNHGYAYGGDPLGNFKRVNEITKLYPFFSQATAQGPMRVALLYMLKQLDAALWLLSQGHESEEGVGERLRDVQVYSVLAQILYEEAQQTCGECGRVCPDDERVEAGMKCGRCAYGG